MANKNRNSSAEILREEIGEGIEILIEGLPNLKPKPFVFVLMPFHSDFDDIYQLGIKAACVSAGAYCERVDEQIFVENILERVYNQIAKADIIVSEMTGRNPNVFYETGYAHALNKRVILLTQNADDIPFDLKHYPHIVYGGKIAHLKTDLEKRITWCIENPTESITKVDLDFDFVINGMTWQEDLEVEIPYRYEVFQEEYGVVRASRNAYVETGKLIFSIQIGLHNISKTVIESSKYHLSLVTPKIFAADKKSDIDTVTINGQNAIIRIAGFRTVFPDDWNSAEIRFLIWAKDLPATPTKFTLKLFSGLGAKDYVFKAKFIPEKSGV